MTDQNEPSSSAKDVRSASLKLAQPASRAEIAQRIREVIDRESKHWVTRRTSAQEIANKLLGEIKDAYDPQNRVLAILEDLRNEIVMEITSALKKKSPELIQESIMSKGTTLFRLKAQYEFLAELGRRYSIGAACRKAGISRNIISIWRQRYPSFDRAIQETMDDALDALEETIYERAMQGDMQAAMAILKSARPEKYRPDAQPVQQQINIENLIYTARQLHQSLPGTKEESPEGGAAIEQETPSSSRLSYKDHELEAGTSKAEG